MIDRGTYLRERAPRFGDRNPSRMNFAFWQHMVRTGEAAHDAAATFGADDEPYEGPVWCFQRFGVTRTRLADGRVVCIGGEHEDHYDPDFCIYNDVVIVSPDGNDLTIYGYPKDVFPPTDFHTATLCDGGERIVIIGGLGYFNERGGAATPVYSLDVRTFKMRRHVSGSGSPGWIYGHRAALTERGDAIQIVGGKIIEGSGRAETHRANERAFEVELDTWRWREIEVPPDRYAIPDIAWPDGWTPLHKKRDADYVLNRLFDQLPPGHPLFAVQLRPWAEAAYGTRVLGKVLDDTPTVATVELQDYGARHAALPKPQTVFYPNLDEWLRVAPAEL